MTNQTSLLSQRFLAKAFHRAQAAESRGADPAIQLLLSEAQCPEFFAMRSLDEARQFRAELAMAERSGAIRLVLAKHKAAPGDVKAVIVANLEALGLRLGLDVRATQIVIAREHLAPHLADYPVLEAALERWRTGRTVRGSVPTPETVRAILDAIRVHQARAGRVDDVLLRRESIRLFRDSKRIEALSRWLDVLQEGALAPSGLTRQEIFNGLGLHKEPQPFLIAADAVVEGEAGESRLFRPFHGLPTAAIARFKFPSPPTCILTVENLATFHELVTLARTTQAAVVYTGGMPSPAWRQAFLCLLRSVGEGVPLYHSGDIDVGGFRIAHAVSNVAAQMGGSLRPWRMDPEVLVRQGYALYAAKPAQIAAMRRWCDLIGWIDIAASLQRSPGLIEQELIRPELPES